MKDRRVCSIVLIAVFSGCVLPASPGLIGSPIPHTAGAMEFDGIVGVFEWEGALEYRSVFTLEDAGRLSGRYPFELKILGDEQFVHFGLTVTGLEKVREEDGSGYLSESLQFMLADAHGPLTPPADGIDVGHLWEAGASTTDIWWSGTAWETQEETEKGTLKNGTPTGGRWAKGTVADNSTLVVEVMIARTSAIDSDAFQQEGPSDFRLCLQLIRYLPWDGSEDISSTRFASLPYPSDRPGGERDSSDWLGLRLDY
jgi:hypothetical protein